MMNSKLKTILANKTKDGGFAFTLTLALGLIMVLVAIAAIIRSQQEKIISSAQRETTRGLSIAQTGVNRYRELIDKNKIIAMYPACVTWNTTTGVCQDGATVQSWYRAANIPGVSPACTGGDTTSIQNATNRQWQDVDASDPSRGQYRLIDYSYNADYNAGTSTYGEPTGTLTVEGRVNQKGTGNTATDAINTATTQLTVEIPIQPGIPLPPVPVNAAISLDSDFNSQDPALWIGSGSATNVGTLTVDGNILFSTNSSCNIPTASGNPTSSNLQNSQTQSIIADPRTLPNPPDLLGSGVTYQTISNTEIMAATELPRPGDSGDGNNYYHYLVEDDLDVSGGDLNIRDGTKVILYVQGNINLEGNVNQNGGSNTSAYLEIYGNYDTGGGSYRYNCAAGVTCPTADIDLAGDIDVKAFIHAPAATVSEKTVGVGSTVDFIGALWVNNWNTPNSTITITPDDQYFYYTTIENMVTANTRVVDPIVFTPSSWNTEEVQ